MGLGRGNWRTWTNELAHCGPTRTRSTWNQLSGTWFHIFAPAPAITPPLRLLPYECECLCKCVCIGAPMHTRTCHVKTSVPCHVNTSMRAACTHLPTRTHARTHARTSRHTHTHTHTHTSMTHTNVAGHSWPDDYPSSYDAISGNNHGVCVYIYNMYVYTYIYVI